MHANSQKKIKLPNLGFQRFHYGCLALSVFCGFSSLAIARTINFTSGEGYDPGDLQANADWMTNNFAQVQNTGNRVLVNGFTDAVFRPGQPLNAGDVYTAEIDFSFVAGDNASVSNTPNRSIVNVSFYAFNNPTSARLKIGLVRASSQFVISAKTGPISNASSVVSFTGGEPRISSPVDAGQLGINRNSDLQSDNLRLRMTATRGVGESEWRLRGELFNLTAGNALLSTINLSGLSYNTGDWIRAGFGSGHNNDQSGVSQRLVSRFRFDREDRSNAVVVPAPVTEFGSQDANGNGLPDLAELLSPQIAQIPTDEDSDGDGISNLNEARGGTDPFDSSSYLRSNGFSRAALTGDSVTFSFASVPGVRYRIEHSDSIDEGTWESTRINRTANSLEMTVTIPLDDPSLDIDPDNCFFRARILRSVDSDGDGVEDNLERFLGFNPNDANSVNSEAAGGDFAQFYKLIQGASSQAGEFNSSSAGVPSPEQTSRFLAQASFGPSEDLIRYVRSLGEDAFSKWIDEQLEVAPTLTEEYRDLIAVTAPGDVLPSGSGTFVNRSVPYYSTRFADVEVRNIQTVWMRQALFAPDRLRQRVAWVLSQILVASSESSRHGAAQSVYYDLLIEHALGNYEDLLFEVSVNPLMGRYLSSLGNQRLDLSEGRFPDENYAREIMQLFSIGLWELNLDGTRILDASGNPIPTYGNEDIVQVARVFTGLELQGGSNFNVRLADHPMRMIDSRHDDGNGPDIVSFYGDRRKIFLRNLPRYTPPALPRFTSANNRDGFDDIRDTVSILFNHPNCAPFISRNLIQHLVTSNPSPAYVERVAQVFVADDNGVRGNLGAVVKAILLDEEARSLNFQLTDQPGRLKAPMLRLTSLASAFEAGVESQALHDFTGVQFFEHPEPNNRAFESFLEFPFNHPSVFNFYEPGYAHPGDIRNAGLVSPEFQILNSLTAVNMPNQFYGFIDDRFHTVSPDRTNPPTPDFSINTDDYIDDAENDRDRLLDRLNILLCHGRLSAATRATIKASLDNLDGRNSNRIAEQAIYLVLTSPDAAILR